jgi:hypothetical protein
MATLKDAEKARVVMADQLQGYGAHAISVQELDSGDDAPADSEDGSSEPSTGRRRASYEVVAWFAEEPPDTLPAEVEIQRGTKTVMVPVRVRREERFQLE